jgi:hypothetical protein
VGFLSRLFGTKNDQENTVSVQPIDYKGFSIFPESLADNGQYRIAGRITIEDEGVVKEHRFIRSDVLMSRSDADELMVTKAKMLIDQMGKKIFSD